MVAALVCGLAATFILLLIFSWLFTKTQIPAWWAVPLATAAVCVGCFVSAHVLAKKIKKNGLFCGLCAGAFFFVIYLAAALLNGQFEFTTLASIKLVCYLLAGCFGGYLGILAAESSCARTTQNKNSGREQGFLPFDPCRLSYLSAVRINCYQKQKRYKLMWTYHSPALESATPAPRPAPPQRPQPPAPPPRPPKPKPAPAPLPSHAVKAGAVHRRRANRLACGMGALYLAGLAAGAVCVSF